MPRFSAVSQCAFDSLRLSTIGPSSHLFSCNPRSALLSPVFVVLFNHGPGPKRHRNSQRYCDGRGRGSNTRCEYCCDQYRTEFSAIYYYE